MLALTRPPSSLTAQLPRYCAVPQQRLSLPTSSLNDLPTKSIPILCHGDDVRNLTYKSYPLFVDLLRVTRGLRLFNNSDRIPLQCSHQQIQTTYRLTIRHDPTSSLTQPQLDPPPDRHLLEADGNLIFTLKGSASADAQA